MAEITIREINYQSAGSYDPKTCVVYIPGMATFKNAQGQDLTPVLNKPTLCKDVATFMNIFGAQPQVYDTNVEDKSYIMAFELLKLGAQVLYEAIGEPSGNDYIAVNTPAKLIQMISGADFLTKLIDRGSYDIRFVTAGGYGNLSTASDSDTVAKALMSVAASRGDCTALIDLASTVNNATDIINAYNSLNSGNEKFAAGYTPWCNFSTTHNRGSYMDGETKITISGNVLLPGSFAYLAAFAASTQTNPNWYAAAGASRGQIPNIVNTNGLHFGDSAVNALQTREEGKIAINPICNINPYGYIIWGNRTLAPNAGGSGLTGISFMNVRQIISDIRKTLYVSAKGLMFEQNSDILWVNFKSLISPLLDKMQSSNGIKGYKLIKVNTDVKGQLKAKVRIIPIEAVESFDLTIELADSLDIVTE